MPEMLAQPDATEVPTSLIESLVRDACPGGDMRLDFDVVHHHGHTNDIAEVRFADGRTLMVKRGRYDWSDSRFRSSRAAAALLSGSGVVTPAPLPIADEAGPRPVEAYWRVPLPTLAELWPVLSRAQQRQALLSWGEVMRRLHQIRLADHGPLDGSSPRPRSLAHFLDEDLGVRLRPAIAGVWPAALPLLELLISLVPALEDHAEQPGALLHGDVHMGNVLCEIHDDRVRCVGLLDLETAHVGLPESDLARLEITNSTLFGYPMPAGALDEVLEGYAERLDPRALGFYRIYHYLNLGFHSQLIGHEWHAEQIEKLARADAEQLREMAHGETPRRRLRITLSR